MVPGWQKRYAQAPGLSLFLHHLGLNPYIPMVRWLWLCPCEVLGAQWGHPTCTGAGRVQDSHLGRGWRTPGGQGSWDGAAQQSFAAQWPRVGRTVRFGSICMRGGLFSPQLSLPPTLHRKETCSFLPPQKGRGL